MSLEQESRRVLRSSRVASAPGRLDRWTIEQVQLDDGAPDSRLTGWSARKVSVAGISGGNSRLVHLGSPPFRHALLLAQPDMLFEGQDTRPGQCVLLPPKSRCTARLRARARLYLVTFEDAEAPIRRADDISLYQAPPLLADSLKECDGQRPRQRTRSGKARVETSMQSAIEQMLLSDGGGEPLLAPIGRRRMVHAALDYVHSHLDKRITLADLCSVAKAGVRTVEYAFRDFCDVSPIRYVRSCRLERVHAELSRGAPRSGAVMEAAMRWGFTHMGQFARDYRLHYGETPSQTLAARGEGN